MMMMLIMMMMMMKIVYMNVYVKRYMSGLNTTIRSSKSASCKKPVKELLRLRVRVRIRLRVRVRVKIRLRLRERERESLRSLHKKSYMSWLTVWLINVPFLFLIKKHSKNPLTECTKIERVWIVLYITFHSILHSWNTITRSSRSIIQRTRKWIQRKEFSLFWEKKIRESSSSSSSSNSTQRRKWNIFSKRKKRKKRKKNRKKNPNPNKPCFT